MNYFGDGMDAARYARARPYIHPTAIEKFRSLFASRRVQVDAPAVVQTLSEADLVRRVPLYDGWIIGDDPATRAVFAAGAAGRLRAAVKWGVGTDNVDVAAAEALGIPVANTPEMFGAEVADVALGYLIGLARELFAIDRGVRRGQWPKSCGVSLAGRTVGLVGFGDIGRQLARRLLALDLQVIVYDPKFAVQPGLEAVAPAPWPERIEWDVFYVDHCSPWLDAWILLKTVAVIAAGERRFVRRLDDENQPQ